MKNETKPLAERADELLAVYGQYRNDDPKVQAAINAFADGTSPGWYKRNGYYIELDRRGPYQDPCVWIQKASPITKIKDKTGVADAAR